MYADTVRYLTAAWIQKKKKKVWQEDSLDEKKRAQNIQNRIYSNKKSVYAKANKLKVCKVEKDWR